MFDGGLTRDGSGRPLKQLVWEQVGTSDITLSIAIDAANAANGGAGSPRLVIPGAKLASMAEGAYTLRLTAVNFLDVSSSASASFDKRPMGATPVVSVVGGTQQTFSIAQGISLTTQLLPSSVCSSSKVRGAVWMLLGS